MKAKHIFAIRYRRQQSAINAALSRIWFWLTADIECSWCRKTMHRAPLGGGGKSHGMCAKCADKFTAENNL